MTKTNKQRSSCEWLQNKQNANGTHTNKRTKKQKKTKAKILKSTKGENRLHNMDFVQQQCWAECNCMNKWVLCFGVRGCLAILNICAMFVLQRRRCRCRCRLWSPSSSSSLSSSSSVHVYMRTAPVFICICNNIITIRFSLAGSRWRSEFNSVHTRLIVCLSMRSRLYVQYTEFLSTSQPLDGQR